MESETIFVVHNICGNVHFFLPEHIEITIYNNFHNFLLIFLFDFQWLPWNRKLWKNCLTFDNFSLMFCGETLTNAPRVQLD